MKHTPALSVDWLRNLMDFKVELLHKDHEALLGRNETSILLKRESDAGVLIAKLFKRPSFMGVIGNTIYRSPAQRNWRFAHLLLDQDIDVPKPMAFIEERKMGFKLRSWYICRFDGGMPGDEYFMDSPSFTPSMKSTISSIVSLFQILKKCQLSHGNLKAANLLITDNNPTLINFDTMRLHASAATAEKMHRQDILHFMDSWRERYDIHKQFQQAFSKAGINI